MSGTVRIDLYDNDQDILSVPRIKSSLRIDIESWSTQHQAIEYATTAANEIGTLAKTKVVPQSFALDWSASGGPLRKTVVFGSTLGLLMAIGFAYL